MTSSAVHPFLMGLVGGSDPGTLLPLAPGSLDWEEVVREAHAQGLIPLLYRSLKGSEMGRELPVGVADRLEAQFFGVAARNMLLAAELKEILRAFEDQRLPCAPLRGLALAEALYGDITARPMGDLDLLVQKEDLPRVARILRELGFREIDRRPGFAQAFSYSLEFFKDRHGWIIVEPHWTITYPPFADRVDMEGVWERCARGRVVGVEAWLLGREDVLLNLCLHLAHRDGSAPLLWFFELDRLLRREQDAIDWSRVLSVASQAKQGALLFRALGRVKALFDTPIPDPVLDQPAVELPRSVEGRLARLLAEGSTVDGKESLALLFTLAGFSAKFSYALALLFPSPEFMRLEYGLTRRGQLGFAYVRRGCRLAWESLKGVVKLLA